MARLCASVRSSSRRVTDMGVDASPFIGLGYMLRKSDTDADTFEEIFDELLELEGDIEVWSDCYCGAWIFVGDARTGDESEPAKVELGRIESNGDDIDLEIKDFLGKDHLFFKYAKFGLYFGTYYT